MGIDKPMCASSPTSTCQEVWRPLHQKPARRPRNGLQAVAWMVHGAGDVPSCAASSNDSGRPSPPRNAWSIQQARSAVGFTEAAWLPGPSCCSPTSAKRLALALVATADRCWNPGAAGRDVQPRKPSRRVPPHRQRFGAAHVVDVFALVPAPPRLPLPGHKQLSVYGIGKESTRAVAAACLRQLTARLCSNPCPMAMAACAWGPRGSRCAPCCAENGGLELALRRPKERRRWPPPALSEWGQRSIVSGSKGPGAGSRGRSPKQGPGRCPSVDGPEGLATPARPREQRPVPPIVVSTTAPGGDCRPASRPPSQRWREISGIGTAPKLERYGERGAGRSGRPGGAAMPRNRGPSLAFTPGFAAMTTTACPAGPLSQRPAVSAKSR